MQANIPPVVIGCDHAAYQLKEEIKKFLTKNGISVEDVGAYNEESVDYPDIGIKLASMISKGNFKHGILLCGTGIGMSMVANRFPYVRAALCNNMLSAIMSKRHNNANILVLGGRVVGEFLAIEIVKVWLETHFEQGRHERRIELFDHIGDINV